MNPFSYINKIGDSIKVEYGITEIEGKLYHTVEVKVDSSGSISRRHTKIEVGNFHEDLAKIELEKCLESHELYPKPKK